MKFGICVTGIIFKLFIIYELSFAANQPFYGNGFNFQSNNNGQVVAKQTFFEMIAKVPLNIDDIEEMYRNVTAESNSWNCEGKCRTPIALWVTQSIAPCQDILKEDCPKGLVCCKEFPKPISNSLKRSDIGGMFYHRDSEWDESKFDPMTFRQDPIPGDDYRK